MRKNNRDKWQLTSYFTFGDMLRMMGSMVKKENTCSGQRQQGRTAINYCHKGIPDGYPKVNQDFCEISWSLNVDSCWCPKKYYGHQIKHPWAELGGQLACSLCFNSQHFWNLIFHHMTLSLSVLSLPSASNQDTNNSLGSRVFIVNFC